MSTSPPSLTLAQAYVLRAQLDVLIAMLEGQAPVMTACEHPDEKRLDTSTAGQPATFLCQLCGATVEGVA